MKVTQAIHVAARRAAPAFVANEWQVWDGSHFVVPDEQDLEQKFWALYHMILKADKDVEYVSTGRLEVRRMTREGFDVKKHDSCQFSLVLSEGV